MESNLREEKKVTASVRERKAVAFFYDPGGCVSMVVSVDLTLCCFFFKPKLSPYVELQ